MDIKYTHRRYIGKDTVAFSLRGKYKGHIECPEL